jgi:hypothetical protein
VGTNIRPREAKLQLGRRCRRMQSLHRGRMAASRSHHQVMPLLLLLVACW